MQLTSTILPDITFIHFLFSNKRNIKLLLIALFGTIVQFVIFKTFYPFPDFFSDSYSYLYGAYANLDISIWPIGYSKFLFFFHHLTYSSTPLITFQYFLLEGSAAYFFFTLIFFLPIAKSYQLLIYAFLFFNPLFLYISNYINSDPLFAAVSILWLSELLWILFKPNQIHIFSQGILLFLCFAIRNNAYYYPILAAIVFLLSNRGWKYKLIGSLFPFIFLVPFIIYTRNAAYKLTGQYQYSLFTGWQLANNALYMRGHITVDSSSLPNKATQDLDKLAKTYFSKKDSSFDEYLSGYVANFFIRTTNAPLKVFFITRYHPNSQLEIVADWGKCSITFGSYGGFLISHYPLAFFRYYLLRNAVNYFLPPLEKLEVYNLGESSIEPIAQYWFHFQHPIVTASSKDIQGKLLFVYPILFLMLNFYFIGNVCFFIFEKHSMKSLLTPTLVFALSFWMLNFTFSVFATINVFRYQITPMIMLLSASSLFTLKNDKNKLTSSIPSLYANH